MSEVISTALLSVVVPVFDASELREKVARLLPHSEHAPVPVSEAVVGAEDDATQEAFKEALATVMEHVTLQHPGIDLRCARIVLEADSDENGSPCIHASVYADDTDWKKFRGLM